MSYIVLHDRIKETSKTQGTGPFELEGAVAGFSAFSDVYATGDVVFYAITDGTDYEIGSGIYDIDSTDQLSRFVIRSSNANALVDFPAGLKEVYVTYPATNAVYHGSGLSVLQAPEEGGVAFWVTNNIVGYDDNITWDSGNVRLGIRNRIPDYAIDVGGNGYESNVQASGFLVGTSGVYFPQANNGDSQYPGGRQVVHFEPNDVLDVDVQQYAAFSGDVNQYLYFKDQTKGHVLAGPPSGCAGDCSPATPTFRLLTLEDIPNLDSLYATDGELLDASGFLKNYTTAVSGMVIDSGTQLFNDLQAASGKLFDDVLGSSGVADRLFIDLTDTENTAFIRHDTAGKPTHLRLINTNGPGARLLLECSNETGNTWANISLSDGAYRLFNFTADITVDVSGILPGTNQIILDSGYAWDNFLPLNVSGDYVSGAFLNGGDPSGIKIIDQFPPSGHILTLESAPTDTGVPVSVTIMNVGRNGISIDQSSNVGIDLDPQSITAKLDIRGDNIRIRNSGVVPTNTSDGYKGEIRWDDNYLYVCTANNSWKRVALDGTPWS